VSFAAITFYLASQRVFIVVVYFVIDSIRKLLDTLSYIKIGLKGIGCEGLGLDLEHRVPWRAVVNTVTNLRVP
jgi:hypothetical protein